MLIERKDEVHMLSQRELEKMIKIYSEADKLQKIRIVGCDVGSMIETDKSTTTSNVLNVILERSSMFLLWTVG